MTITIKKLSQVELSENLGLAEHLDSDTDTSTPSPWGIARLIRREVRRRGLATRRELRKAIEPFLIAAGFNTDANAVIRDVADRMVGIGELADLRVENQRGYAALPSRWIELHENDAVLLGTTATETHRFFSCHPHQFLRRFRPQDRIVADLDRIGVYKQSFNDWLGEPGWKKLVDTTQRIESLSDLLGWHIAKLEEEGILFSLSDTPILAIKNQPGVFFGQPWDNKNSRWIAPSKLPDGIYLGAQHGYAERQWHPLLLSISAGVGKSRALHCNNDNSAVHELRNWLLIALGSHRSCSERVEVDLNNCEIQLTFPAPAQLRSCLNLAGEESKTWRYSVLDSRATERLLSRAFPEISFIMS